MILLFTNSIIIYAVPKPAEIINMPPTIDLSARPKKKPVDIVIMTDYTGTKLVALQNQINLLKAKFENVNVDPVFHVINDMKKIGTQTDAMYNWYREAGVIVKWNEYYNYRTTQYSSPYTERCSTEWETIQELESKFASLPKRSPTNIRYGNIRNKLVNNGSQYNKYFLISVYADNDEINQVDDIWVTEKFENYVAGDSGYYKNGLISITPFVDTKWQRGEKLYDINFDIMSLDFDKLTTVPLRSYSDRYIMFISDNIKKEYSESQGYFSFGDLSEQVDTYIKNNNVTAIAVTPDEIGNTWLLGDKVKDVVPLGSATMFKMKDDSWKKLGNRLYRTWYGFNIYPVEGSNVGKVKKVLDSMVLFEDGSLKTYNSEIEIFEDFPGILPPRVTFNNVNDFFNSNGTYYFETKDNKAYMYVPWMEFENVKQIPGLTSLKKIIDNQNTTVLDREGRFYFIKSETVNVYDNNGKKIGSKLKVTTQQQLTKRLIYKEGRRGEYNYFSTEIIPRIKDAKGNIYLFENGDLTYEEKCPGYDINLPNEACLIRYVNTQSPSWGHTMGITIDTNVSEVYFAGSNIYYKKNDGTYKAVGWTTDKLLKTPVNINVSNIKNISLLPNGLLLVTDTQNNLYISSGINHDRDPEAMTIIGNFDIDSIYELPYKCYSTNLYGPEILLKTKTNEAYILSFTYEPYIEGNHQSSSWYSIYSTFKGIKKLQKNLLFVRVARQVGINNKSTPKEETSLAYLVFEDGSVRGYGYSDFGQLGKIGTFADIDPFVNVFALTNTTKKYITLNTLLKDSLSNKFYSTGQYAAAFEDIYKQYENNSGAGSMYILLGDEIEYDSAYSDRENDPEYQRKWLISHDSSYFDNSLGISAYHNPTGFTTNPPNKLDKVGKYVINLKVRDNPKNNNLFDNYRLWSTGDQNLTLYVHRKPIPLMNVNVTQNPDETYKIIATDGGSYDLDHTSMANKGITAWEWAWRDQWEDSWHYERMNRLDATGDRAYIIGLRVKDIEGIWSDWIYQTIDNRQPPIAKFDLTKTAITTSELAQIKDTSYAIMSNLTNWHWIVKRINADGSIGTTLQEVSATSSNAGTGGYDTNLNITKTNPGIGKYRIYLRVKADNGLWSDGGTDAAPNSNLIPNGDAEQREASGIPTDWNTWASAPDKVTFKSRTTADWKISGNASFEIITQPNSNYAGVYFKDVPGIAGHSYSFTGKIGAHRCQGYFYINAMDSSNNVLGTYVSNVVTSPVVKNVSINFTAPANTKTLRVHIVNGNTTEYVQGYSEHVFADDLVLYDNDATNNMFYRDLTINQALKIDDVSIQGRWNHFRGWTDKFGVYKDVMKDTTYVDEKGVNQYPYRFLSYEKVDITIKLEGYADKVIIDFPDGLGSMTYTDKLGYSYSYRDDVGYTISFPYEIAINPTLKDPIITWSYILPLVNSSASWENTKGENTRLKQPYTISIKAIKGTYEITQTKKIDITGNVDDLIFIQPVER